MDADPDPGSALEKMDTDPNPDPGCFLFTEFLTKQNFEMCCLFSLFICLDLMNHSEISLFSIVKIWF